MPSCLLDSFTKADGENGGVNTSWALNGDIIPITVQPSGTELECICFICNNLQEKKYSGHKISLKKTN